MENAEGPYPWFALLVRNRFEKVVALSLIGKGYSVFLPLSKSRRRWSDREPLIDLPLFPGYLFCRVDLRNQLPILTTRGVRQIVGYGKVPVPISEPEIEFLQRIVSSPSSYEPCSYLTAGQAVRLTRGPLAGLDGIFVKTQKQCRLVVSVSLLQRSVAVEVDMDSVEVIQPPRKPPVSVRMEPVRPGWASSAQYVGTC
ncbi:MAG: transcription termination/antitermination NusG family protein [Candidatus Solibacter sp.]